MLTLSCRNHATIQMTIRLDLKSINLQLNDIGNYEYFTHILVMRAQFNKALINLYLCHISLHYLKTLLKKTSEKKYF